MALKVEEQAVFDAAEWLFRTSDAILACRGQGHAWPKLTPGKRNRRGIRYTRWSDGSVELHFTCSDCGAERIIVTNPGGVIELPAKYRYVHPPGYKAPKGVAISRRECFRESNRRWLDEMQQAYEGLPPAMEK